jgi:IstB-like ATP binding protein
VLRLLAGVLPQLGLAESSPVSLKWPGPEAISAWHEVIGDPTYADAILDRLVHNAHRIELTGESLRRVRGKQSKTA